MRVKRHRKLLQPGMIVWLDGRQFEHIVDMCLPEKLWTTELFVQPIPDQRVLIRVSNVISYYLLDI